MLSLVGTIHTAIAIFVNTILADPSSASMDMLNLTMIETHLRYNTFMNIYAMPLISGNNEANRTDSAQDAAVKKDNFKRDHDGDHSSKKTTNDKPKRAKVHNPHFRDTQSNAVEMAELVKGIKAVNIDDGISTPTINRVSVCHNWHLRGICHSSCPRKSTHIKLVGQIKHDYCHFIGKAEKHAMRKRAGN